MTSGEPATGGAGQAAGRPGRRCVVHPEVPAELVCTRCAAWHCRGCARPFTERPGGPLACPSCQGLLTEGQPDLEPDSLGDAFWRIASGEGAMMVFALSLPGMGMVVGTLLAVVAFCLWVGVLGGYFFQTVDHVARHEEGLPFSSDVMFTWDIAGQVMRGAAFLAIAIGPGVLAVVFIPEEPVFAVLTLLAGVSLAPAALIACVVTRSFWAMLWLPAWLQVVARAKTEYLRFLVVLLGSTVVWLAVSAYLTWLMNPNELLWWLVTPFVHTAFVLWVAVLFGRHFQGEANTYGIDF